MHPNSLKQSMLRWHRGLIPLALIWAATPLMLTGPIERDLTARTAALQTKVDGGPVPWATIAIEGRDVVAEGTSPSGDAKGALVTKIEGVDGIRTLIDKTWPLVVAAPFQWNAVSDGSQLILTGYVPPSGERTALVKKAQETFPHLRVSDNMTEAAGASADFANMTTFALTALKPLSTGNVELLDNRFSIRGSVPDSDAYRTVLASTQALPKSLNLNVTDIALPPAPVPPPVSVVETASIKPKPAPPYVWIASHDGKEVALTGAIPNQDARQKLLAVVSRSFNGKPVKDKMAEQADGIPQGFTDAAELALVQLAHLEAGSAAITDQKLTLIGLAPNETVVGQTSTAVSALAGSISGTTSVVARPKPADVTVTPDATTAASDQACAKSLSESTALRRIRFNILKSSLTSASKPMINEIAKLMLRCPTLKVEIAGHTDNTGKTSFNKSLSARRAETVADAIAKAGVSRDRMRSAGYGASKPLASNSTRIGRAANRRIDLVVIQ